MDATFFVAISSSVTDNVFASGAEFLTSLLRDFATASAKSAARE
jgi:hypothetical protein